MTLEQGCTGLQPLSGNGAGDDKPSVGAGSGGPERFLRLLGKDPERTWFATLKPVPGKSSRPNVSRRGADLHGFAAATLQHDNQAGSAVYFRTGDADQATGKNKQGKPTGCVCDADITSCPALFVEWDDRPIEWQVQAWQELALPQPSLMVHSGGKSIHCYWRLREPMAPDQWRVLQKRLIEHAGGDKACSNPSRLMRLPGFRYVDKDTGELTDRVAQLIHQADVTYSAAQIEACLPAPPTPRKTTTPTELPPRPEAELLKALERVPEFFHDQGRRDELLGLAMRLTVEWGADEAHAWLAKHSPTIKDLSGYFNAAPTQINTGSIWPFLREHYGISLKRDDLKPTKAKRKTNKGGSAARSGSGRLAPDEVMESIPAMLGRLRLNTRSGDIISETRGILGANQINRLYLEFSQPGATWPKETTADAVSLLASRDAFDPVVEELQQISAAPLSDDDWAKLDQRLLGIDDPIARSFLPRFLIGAVARAFDPGCDWRQFPVLVGPQWIGKSALGRILFGGAHWVEGVGDLGKDALMRAHTAWGVELGELDGITRRSDQERLKTFLSEREDVFRKPYDKAPERYPRRFTFWGTSNGPPLRDGTGNSRFVCIRLPNKMLPLSWAEQHRGAIWARAVQEYRAGGEWRHCSEEERQLIAERNLNHQELDPWQEPLHKRLEQWKQTNPGKPVTVSEALSWLDVPVERQNNAAAARIRTLMEAMEWTYARRCVQGKNGKSLKRQGFWPVEAEKGRTHRTQRDTTRCVQAEASEEAGSQLPDTPDTPKQEKLKTQVTAPPPPPASDGAPQRYAGKVGQLAMSGVSSHPDPKQRNGSTRTQRGMSGHTAVCPQTIPGFVDPTPAAVGSGADVMDDDDDPHWGPKPQGAAA